MRAMKSFIVLWALLVSSAAFAQNQPPVAEAGPDMTVILNQSTVLDGTASYDPDGDPILYWNWQVVSVPAGAASPLKDAYTPTPLFTGTVAGDYILSLSVFDGQFWSAPDFVTVTVVLNQPPVAIIQAAPTSGRSPLTVQFDGTQSYDPEGGAVQFYWRLGDGSVSTSPTVSHTYIMPGTFVAALTVTDALGAQDETTIPITVLLSTNHPPVASPTATPSAGEAPLQVQFAANAADPDGDPLTYAWTFGDGEASTAANPTHTYAQAGDYVAWLTISDGQTSISASLVITVSSNLTITVQRLEVKYQGSTSTLANVKLTTNFAGITPTGDDVVAASIDGVWLFAAPFSSFAATASDPKVYELKFQNLLARLDVTTGTLSVIGRKLDLAGIDLSNGADVQLTVGQATAVQNVRMVAQPHRDYIYIAPAPLELDSSRGRIHQPTGEVGSGGTLSGGLAQPKP